MEESSDWADDVVEEIEQPKSFYKNRASLAERRASFGRQNAITEDVSSMESMLGQDWTTASQMIKSMKFNFALNLTNSDLRHFESSEQLKLANRANRWNTFVVCRNLLWITPQTEGYAILTKLLEDAAEQSGPIILVFQVLVSQFSSQAGLKLDI